MQFYSTNNPKHKVGFRKAVLRGLAPDKGLYLPERIEPLPASFWADLDKQSDVDIAFHVLRQFVYGAISDNDLRSVVEDAISLPFPVVKITDRRYCLELFHGPTLAFKDVGARCMGRILPYCIDDDRETIVLVATSGDTGSAVAHGFLGVQGVRVVVLYPKGKVSPLQERQMATLGMNITALAVDGVFDDCQALVKQAFVDKTLSQQLRITSANSINLARWLPQAIYYIVAFRELGKRTNKQPVICVPSGNYGNLTAGIVAERLGLPVRRWIAASNANSVVPEYLAGGEYKPRPSVQTLSSAMDVGAPSNFDRLLALFNGDRRVMKTRLWGCSVSDQETLDAITEVHEDNGYVLDPHGATGYVALKRGLQLGEVGLFLETAHPAKFSGAMEKLGIAVEVPDRLAKYSDMPVLAEEMENDYGVFLDILRNL